MQTIAELQMLRSAVDAARARGETVALVPTMGALHEGHLTLVRAAAAKADTVVVSIFVNPTQFGPGEDLDAYPRQLEEDAALLEAEGVAVLWAPMPETVYPEGFATSVSVSGVSEGLCGASRPGHFDGVATVVCKLFNQVRPDLAVFGEKDWQQLAVIRRMARDLDLTLPHADAILGIPTVREADGLALSSRNRYLDAAQRRQAAAFPAALARAVAALEDGAAPAKVLADARREVEVAGFAVDYLELVNPTSLTPVEHHGARPGRLIAAVRLGTTRLIDNMAVASR